MFMFKKFCFAQIYKLLFKPQHKNTKKIRCSEQILEIMEPKKIVSTFKKTETIFVRMKGLEPPRPETLDPKSNAATNYATCADS